MIKRLISYMKNFPPNYAKPDRGLDVLSSEAVKSLENVIASCNTLHEKLPEDRVVIEGYLKQKNSLTYSKANQAADVLQKDVASLQEAIFALRKELDWHTNNMDAFDSMVP